MKLNNNISYQYAIKQQTCSTYNNRSQGLAPLNLSKAKRNFLLFDTETIGDIQKGEKAFPYDISFINIFDNSIIHKQCYINEDIFDNEYLMSNAFYRNKIPYYKQKLATDKKYQKVNDIQLLSNLNAFIKENDITYFLAYNVNFDYKSISNLYEKVGCKNFFKKLKVIDIWNILDIMFKLCPELYVNYVKFCLKHNYITESGKCIKTSAEIVNRWVNQDLLFIESHTGLEDTLCEFNILQKLLWYYKKKTNTDFYYKLDTVHIPNGTCFKGGIYTLDYIKNKLRLA